MMDCKKALQEAQGRMDAAIDLLKRQGLAKAVKKAGRTAAEGLIFSRVQDTQAALLELNCETDFVAKNEDFKRLGQELVDLVLLKNPGEVADLLELKIGEIAVSERINAEIARFGENLKLRRFVVFAAKEGGRVTLYNHAGGRIAVLVEIKGDKVTPEVAKNIAMQIAAMSPLYIHKEEIPRNVLEKEKSLELEKLKGSGKPPQIMEKIAAGKIDKFAGEIALMEQAYVREMSGKKKVGQYLKEIDPNARVVQFVRYAVGEGLEGRKDDFAEEIKKMTE